MNTVWVVSSNADDKHPVRQVFAKRKDAEAYVEEVFVWTSKAKREDSMYYVHIDKLGFEDEYWEVEKFSVD